MESPTPPLIKSQDQVGPVLFYGAQAINQLLHRKGSLRDTPFEEIPRETGLGEDQEVVGRPFPLNPIPNSSQISLHIRLSRLELDKAQSKGDGGMMAVRFNVVERAFCYLISQFPLSSFTFLFQPR